MFTRAEVDELAISQLSSEDVNSALAALNGFAELFGRGWVEAYFQGARSPAFVRAIMAMWDDWLVVRDLPGADGIRERWARGINEGGVQTEVHTFACLARGRGEIELFPEVRFRVPDCRIRSASTDPWVYVEASQRGLSEVRRRAQEVLLKVSEAAADAVQGRHVKVAILRMPSGEELERIVGWVRSVPASGSVLDDLAEFYLDTLESAIGENDVIEQHVPRPRMFSTRAVLGGDRKGSACLGVSDSGAQELLEAEASQLPPEAPGVVVLDASGVVGGHKHWVPLIQRRLQPTINTRISAVVVLDRALAKEGPRIEGQVLINQHARNQLPRAVIERVERIIRTPI